MTDVMFVSSPTTGPFATPQQFHEFGATLGDYTGLPHGSPASKRSPKMAPKTPKTPCTPAGATAFRGYLPFSLTSHYAQQLEDTIALGFDNMSWTNGFTIVHYAAKKNDLPMLQWICDPMNGVSACLHFVDDFGKKAIDYTNGRKRDCCHDFLEDRMRYEEPRDLDAEEKYQTVHKMIDDGKISAHRASLNFDEIDDMLKRKEARKSHHLYDLEGISTFKLPVNIAGAATMVIDTISDYECENMIPSAYAKVLKSAKGGWEQARNKWPEGYTLLHWAARHDKAEVAKYCMFVLGACPKEEDNSGRTAMEHAKIKKHRKLMKALECRFKGEFHGQ